LPKNIGKGAINDEKIVLKGAGYDMLCITNQMEAKL